MIFVTSSATIAAQEPFPTLAAPPAPSSEDQPAARIQLQVNFQDILPKVSSTSPIDLPTALALAELQNPGIGLTRERINEALAVHKAARALWLPTLNMGTNYHYHTGVLQTSFGEIRNLNEQALYVGGGARTVAADSVAIPAVRIFTHLGDAYFTPLATRQMVIARSYDSQAVQNLTLMDVADRFLALVSAEARLEAQRTTIAEMQLIVNATKAFAEVGQGREADARRAEAEALLMQLEEQRLQEEVGISAARLSQILHLDPAVRLMTQNGPIEVVELVDLTLPVEELVYRAQLRRPETTARSARISDAEYRLRQEETRPYLPLLSIGFSGGAFGGGSNRQNLGVPSTWMTFGGRTDFDVMAVWTLQNLGMGNDALQARQRAERDEAIRMRSLILAQIRNEVTGLTAAAQALQKTMDVAWNQLKAAQLGASEDLRRTRSGVGYPIEALNSMNLLAGARQQLIQSVIAYNRTQFELYVATGALLR